MNGRRRSVTLVVGLGGAQLIAWGSLYYAIAVLGEPMRRELGASSSEVFGAFTLGLVIAGLLAPAAGRSVDRHGGRAVLVASALVGAAGFLVLAGARSVPWIVVGWSIQGVAMALGLYDTCFAAIGQVAPRAYRSVVTGVTLVAGFASTVAWPLSHGLLEAIGWRGVCQAYALALLACAPVYAALLPAKTHAVVPASSEARAPEASVATRARGRARVLSWAFAGAALVGGSISAHLPGVLVALQLRGDQAIAVASSIGVLQVSGRLLDLVLGSRRTAVQLGALTFSGLLVALLLLLATPLEPAAVIGFAVLYGLSNGLLTIARATLAVELFGLADVGARLGSFGAPSLVLRAAAPLGFALVVATSGTAGALASLAAVGLASLAAYGFATLRVPATTSRSSADRATG